MGEHFRTIVDRTATAHDAPALARKLIDSMIGQRIIRAERTDCALGSTGYPPGENVEEALAMWTPESTPGVRLPLDQVASQLRSMALNGVVAVIHRTVFHNFGAGLDVVRCPLCQANDLESDWSEAVSRWYHGDDLAAFQCTFCNEESPITDWIFDPPWAFGNLGFEFWNWPPMRRTFIEKVASILGHRVVLVSGKV
jgi:hypothetical protein